MDGCNFANLLSSSIILFWPFVINLAICFALFTKKRNNILLISLGCAVLLDFAAAITTDTYGYYRIYHWLIFLAYGLLFVFAIAFCEQTFIKADMSKIKNLFSKFYFLPAIFYIAAAAIEWINVNIPNMHGNYLPSIRVIIYNIIRNPLRMGNIPCMGIIFDLLSALTLLSIAQWLKDPYKRLKSKTSYLINFCRLKPDSPNNQINNTNNPQTNNDANYTKKIFRRLMISIFVLAIGVILMFLDGGEITGINVGTCLKCWGKGVVENAYGIMVKCKNCSGGQLAYQNSSFGITGLVGALIAFVSGFSTAIHWNLLKK